MSEFMYFLMAVAVVAIPLFCAWLVVERLARRRRHVKPVPPDQL